jgi:hypothetical protein
MVWADMLPTRAHREITLLAMLICATASLRLIIECDFEKDFFAVLSFGIVMPIKFSFIFLSRINS